MRKARKKFLKSVVIGRRLLYISCIVFAALALILSGNHPVNAAAVNVLAVDLNSGTSPTFDDGDTLSVTGAVDNAGFQTLRGITGKTYRLVLDSATTAIPDYAFYGSNSLLSIEGPDVTTLGASALASIHPLTSVNFPALQNIESDTFSSSYNLQMTTLPATLVTIGDRAFYNCSLISIESIPDSVTSVGIEAFRFCDSIVKMTWTAGTAVIPQGAFMECSGLLELTIPSNVTAIGDSAFERCKSLAKITFSAGALAAIGESAFLNCWKLNSLELPSSVTTIGASAFEWCMDLENVILPQSLNMTTGLGARAFANSALKIVVAPFANPPTFVTTTNQETFSTNASFKLVVPSDAARTNFQSDSDWAAITTSGAFIFTAYSGASLIPFTAPTSLTLGADKIFLMDLSGSNANSGCFWSLSNPNAAVFVTENNDYLSIMGIQVGETTDLIAYTYDANGQKISHTFSNLTVIQEAVSNLPTVRLSGNETHMLTVNALTKLDEEFIFTYNSEIVRFTGMLFTEASGTIGISSFGGTDFSSNITVNKRDGDGLEPSASLILTSDVIKAPGRYTLRLSTAGSSTGPLTETRLIIDVLPINATQLEFDPPSLTLALGTSGVSQTVAVKPRNDGNLSNLFDPLDLYVSPTTRPYNGTMLSASGLSATRIDETSNNENKFVVTGNATQPGTYYAEIELSPFRMLSGMTIGFPITIGVAASTGDLLLKDGAATVTGYSVKAGQTNPKTLTLEMAPGAMGTTPAIASFTAAKVGGGTFAESGLTVATPTATTLQIGGTAVTPGTYEVSLATTIDEVPTSGPLVLYLTVEALNISDFEFEAVSPATLPYTVQMGRANAAAYKVKTTSAFIGVTIALSAPSAVTPAGSGLSATHSGDTFTLSGTAGTPGSYALPLNLTANGVAVSGLEFPLSISTLLASDFTSSLVVGSNAPVTTTNYVMTPNVAGSGTFTLSSVYANGFTLSLQTGLGDYAAFDTAGLVCNTTGGTVTITGTPTVAPGTSYTLVFNVMSGSDIIGQIELTTRIADVDASQVAISADITSVKSGYPANAKFQVFSAQSGVSTVFTGVGAFPIASGLTAAIKAGEENTIVVAGDAAIPGTYTASITAEASGVAIPGREIAVTVLPMAADDYTLTPDKTFHLVYSGIPANLRLDAGTIYAVSDFAVTGATGTDDFAASGLTLTSDSRGITLSGTPKTPGDYRVAVQTLMNTATVTGKEVLIRVKELAPEDFQARSLNNLLLFANEGRADFDMACLAIGLENADIDVEAIHPASNWTEAGLAYELGADGSFAVVGTPMRAGTCDLLIDAVIEGVLVRSIPVTVNVAVSMAEVEAGRIRGAAVKGVPIHMVWGTETEVRLDFLTADDSGVPFPMPNLNWKIQPDNGMLTIEQISPTAIKLICTATPERERKRLERLAKSDTDEHVLGTLDEVIAVSVDIVQAQPDGVPNRGNSNFVMAVGEEQPMFVDMNDDVMEKFREANLFLSSSDVMLIPGNGYKFTTKNPDWTLITQLDNVEIERLMPNGDLLPECFVPSGKDSINVATDVAPQAVSKVGMLPLTYRVVIRLPELASLYGQETAENMLLNPYGFLDEIFDLIVLHKEIKQGEWSGYFTRLVQGILQPREAVDKGILEVAGGTELTVVMYYNVIDFTGEAFLYDDRFLIVPDGLHDGVIIDPIWLNKWDEDKSLNPRPSGSATSSGGGCATGAAIATLLTIVIVRRKD